MLSSIPVEAGAERHDPSYTDEFGERISERWPHPPSPSDLPTFVERDGPAVAARLRPVVTLGGLAARSVADGQFLVNAHDVEGLSWWVPIDAVWSDADGLARPEHVWPVGLATAPTRERALMAGVSDRLGWEAARALERGRDLPPADISGLGVTLSRHARVIDGRLGHAVPTVILAGPDTILWGAGATWDSAVHRALYGDDGSLDCRTELGQVSHLLGEDGLGVAEVELGTALLRRAGIVRSSVQLFLTR